MPCNERQIKTLRLLLVLRLASVKMAAPPAEGGEWKRNEGCELSRKCRSSANDNILAVSSTVSVYKRVLH